jgi:hypothetical protein
MTSTRTTAHAACTGGECCTDAGKQQTIEQSEATGQEQDE